MHTIIKPNTEEKINALAPLSSFDCDGEPALAQRQQQRQAFLKDSIVQVHTPTGPKTILRTVQTSACEKNCNYCPFRAGRNQTPRHYFSPDELAASFIKMSEAKVVNGLFLSSGILGGGVKTMDKILDTAEIVRRKYHYRGYLHLKVMPGADNEQIAHAARLADRISVNLEGVNTDSLAYLAPQKNMYGELLPAIDGMNRGAGETPWMLKRPSIVSQFVVGPAGETDREILTSSSWLYRRRNLARIYYSAFNPVRNTPLENHKATPAIREHRLYQADWLLRFYDFDLAELPFTAEGALPDHIDPKLAWAQQNLVHNPIEINRAVRHDLLRIPGVGPVTANSILQARKENAIGDLGQLKKLGAISQRAAPFVLLNGKRPPQQQSFW